MGFIALTPACIAGSASDEGATPSNDADALTNTAELSSSNADSVTTMTGVPPFTGQNFTFATAQAMTLPIILGGQAGYWKLLQGPGEKVQLDFRSAYGDGTIQHKLDVYTSATTKITSSSVTSFLVPAPSATRELTIKVSGPANTPYFLQAKYTIVATGACKGCKSIANLVTPVFGL